MRIGVFTDSYKPYVGGVVRSIEIFTEELKQLGHEVYIFAPNYPGLPEEEDVFRFPSIPSTYKGFYLGLPFSTRLEEFLNSHPLDIIHVHSPFILGRLGARIAKKLDIPVVFTYHTLYDQYTHYVPLIKDLSKEFTRKVTVSFCNQCDLVITPTQIICTHIENMGVKSNIRWLPTGIDLTEFSSLDRTWLKKKFGLDPGEPVLLFVGRAAKEKNIPFVIDGFAKILEQYHKASLVIVGEGPETLNLKKYVKELALSERVFFTGNLSRVDLVNAYGGADLFVFSSATETQGIVIAEAKAAGLPVVAVNAFGVANMVSDGEDGYLVAMDRQAFSEQIMNLLKDDELRLCLAKRAVENAKQFSSRLCAQKLVQYYQELLDTRLTKTGAKAQ
ncbi:glycosyltransferase family 4 protein [Desulforamulus aeronauticus]|uniref:1,2-diacylglycerol 3-glucosyltransferase n=1 Tax=Desulforamulus aeronauticus DSM 10349 TaxID=1121421 RepID=A0A1M6NDL1_9FIRM|nr:glycosyltransferase family 4 protein [Desulforamulus aeronauticus]SHJ93696.1 1,2-diacylglycerol 3-glucosyltransferase [Desulforamulus aeronauticus DSM 10349]